MPRTLRVALFTALASLAGCTADAVDFDDDDDDDEPTDSVESAARRNEERFTGLYEVPTDAQLAPFASNPIEVRVRTESGGSFRLKYKLPTVIAGDARRIDLDGRPDGAGGWDVSGREGNGRCAEAPDGELACLIAYSDGLELSLAEATAAVNAISKTDEERAARQAVAEKFIIDPLGIVKFKRARR
ncbi:MAG: hypothetical protein KF782_17420 [Labilithrix sp.]|nr:hypothetical protein [Labilithrix sp.]